MLVTRELIDPIDFSGVYQLSGYQHATEKQKLIQVWDNMRLSK